MARCRACRHHPAPLERGIGLCAGCTHLLRKALEQPELGLVRVIERPSYGQACELCGEHRNRVMLVHPEWGRICEVDVREAAEFHGTDSRRTRD